VVDLGCLDTGKAIGMIARGRIGGRRSLRLPSEGVDRLTQPKVLA
jgi:hypothetical protein